MVRHSQAHSKKTKKDIIMAIEAINPSQQATAIETENICQQSLQQKLSQEAAESAKKAKEELDKAMQKIAELPYDMIGQLYDVIEKLMKILNGYENPSNPEFNASKIIAKLESMLNPVISALQKLPVPSIPGLSDIVKLLAKLSALASSNDDSSPPDPKKLLPQIPPEVINILEDLLLSIQSLCATLPLVLINVIFQMLNVIIGMFTDIAGIIGVPSIPYPLSLVPDCISMVPDILDFMMNAPIKISLTTRNIIRKKIKQMMDMQIPKFPDNVEIPESLPCCPDHE